MPDVSDDAGRAAENGPRRERSHVEFPGATWTSFDRYARYGAIVRAVRETLGGVPSTVVDVGDASGYLTAFAPEWYSVGVDVQRAGEHLAAARLVLGDGARLPIRDTSADAVVSSDALEHVPPSAREDFIRELARASRDVVVIAAPFDTPGVAGVEELARRHAALATGRPQEQLDEHADNGLPAVDATMRTLEAEGFRVAARGNGNLSDWLVFMLLKHQLAARPALLPLDSGFDVAYNLAFAARSETPPFYRHVIVGSRSRDPQFGQPLDAIDGLGDPAATFSSLFAITATEVARQDTVPALDGVKYEVDQISRRVLSIESRLEGIDEKLDRLVEALRHPLRTLGTRGRRGSQPD